MFHSATALNAFFCRPCPLPRPSKKSEFTPLNHIKNGLNWPSMASCRYNSSSSDFIRNGLNMSEPSVNKAWWWPIMVTWSSQLEASERVRQQSIRDNRTAMDTQWTNGHSPTRGGSTWSHHVEDCCWVHSLDPKMKIIIMFNNVGRYYSNGYHYNFTPRDYRSAFCEMTQGSWI